MFRKVTLAAVAALGISAFGLSTGASATPYAPGSPLPVFENTSDGVQTVASKRQKRIWKYNQRRDGNRFRSRHGNYRHYHNGYYYQRPFWNLGSGFSLSIGLPAIAQRSGNAHVQWCLNNYRSYNPATDTFNGYDGLRHRCNSPYN
ncbi:BA14K family protein [soil metagenome]